ncbi:Single-stranded DNA-binding protein ssb [Sporomusa ovata DSM 2662]|uniref:Single-stranded DNA-binding protein n=1 Tax=Sporomusa ovata TaxID=2378 RepID=A0A0U1L1X0_9FIRM|nr:single-stranded DNA-binding protein [Sporomusa ovata]EQB27485.1 single-stranded DNA-binding protein 3 [Sporomusa ovata DSM 2662]CQR73329.1 Single-stranded DNA-binding protein [Sporomusa ovata]
MNKVILVGRLAQDPEVRYTQSGKAVASFSLAVNRYAGQGQNSVDFIPIVAWEKLAETCGNNLNKGQRVLVDGRLQIRSYEANDGQKRRVAEVVAQSIEFLERRQTPPSGAAENIDVNSFGKDVFPDEEIPF